MMREELYERAHFLCDVGLEPRQNPNINAQSHGAEMNRCFTSSGSADEGELCAMS